MKKKYYQKVDWKPDPDYIPAKYIRDDIMRYYVSNGYKEKGIPLNVSTIMDIYKILNKNNAAI